MNADQHVFCCLVPLAGDAVTVGASSHPVKSQASVNVSLGPVFCCSTSRRISLFLLEEVKCSLTQEPCP